MSETTSGPNPPGQPNINPSLIGAIIAVAASAAFITIYSLLQPHSKDAGNTTPAAQSAELAQARGAFKAGRYPQALNVYKALAARYRANRHAAANIATAITKTHTQKPFHPLTR